MNKNKLLTNIIIKLITIVLFSLIVVVYMYISDNKLFNPIMFPKISDILQVFFDDVKDGIILDNLVSSLQLLAPSILIMTLIALFVGTIVGKNEVVRNILNPIIYAFSCVPAILMIPFLRVLTPSDWWASIIMIVYHTVWATLFSTIIGIQSVDKRYIESADTLNIKGIKKFTKIVLPAASPAILGGFVNSLRASFVMLVFAEMYSAGRGMGQYVRLATRQALYQRMWAGLVFMILILIIVMTLFEQLKNYILRWTIEDTN